MEGLSTQSSLIGATIGNYRVVAKLGEGGMGAVYLAEHPLIGKKVALKVLHEEYSANQDVVARFFNEAKAVNDIGHPNIVDIIDYGVVKPDDAPGFVYFIMEFLGGESLASLIERESPLEPDRAFNIAMQVADALSASHQKGVIHRDLKPDNIFLIQFGREKDFVKVLDFGIAKLTGDAPGSRRTRTGIVMGTPAYMSPEQCEGKGNVDARTDIYALGIVLYEMLTGRVPFAGEGYGEVLVQHLTMRPARPTTARGALPPVVEAVVMKTLEKRRDDRFETMADFMDALRDPQAYIDARGGLDAFYRPDEGVPAGTAAPMVPGGARTPYPVSAATPGLGMHAPGSQPGVAGAGGSVPGVEIAPAGKSRAPLYIAGAVAALALVGGGIFLLGRGGGGEKAAGANPTAPAGQPGATPVEPKPVPPPVDPPAKEPTPQPVLQESVVIKVASVPKGADVFVGDDAEPRGQTPIQLDLPKGDGEVELIVRLDGYKERRRTVKLSRDAELELPLEKEKKATASGGTSKRPPKEKPPQDKPPQEKPPKKKPGEDDVLAPKF